MSVDLPPGIRHVPLSYRLYRGVIVSAFVLVLVFIGLGAAGHGPAQSFGAPVSTAALWVKQQMGIAEPLTKPVTKKPVKKPVKTKPTTPTKKKPQDKKKAKK